MLPLAATARRLAQVWEDNAQWTLCCRSIRVDESAQRFVYLQSDANSNMLKKIWEFGHTLIPRLDEAILALSSGGPTDLQLTLTLTVDADELSEDIARFGTTLLE